MATGVYRFTPLTAAGLDLVATWFEAPHVTEWWPGDGVGEIARGLAEPGFDAYLVVFDGRPFAYLQVYDPFAEPDHPYQDQPPGSRGVDLFIGEASMLGCGHGSALLREMSDRLLEAHHPRVLIDPDPTNGRAIRAYEKAGFRHLGLRSVEFPGEGAVAVALMARDRKES